MDWTPERERSYPQITLLDNIIFIVKVQERCWPKTKETKLVNLISLYVLKGHKTVHLGVWEVVLVVKNPPANAGDRRGFGPWVWKIPWRRAWQPTPVFLPGESHAWIKESGRLQSIGLQRVGCNWAHRHVHVGSKMHFWNEFYPFIIAIITSWINLLGYDTATTQS